MLKKLFIPTPCNRLIPGFRGGRIYTCVNYMFVEHGPRIRRGENVRPPGKKTLQGSDPRYADQLRRIGLPCNKSILFMYAPLRHP